MFLITRRTEPVDSIGTAVVLGEDSRQFVKTLFEFLTHIEKILGRMTATMRFLTVAAAPLGSLAGGAIATVIGLRATLLVVAALGVLLAAAAVAWSPVRRHRTLPTVAAN